MSDVIREQDMTAYAAYIFSGIWQYKRNGRELKTMSLKECFNEVFSVDCNKNMKQFLESNDFHFVIRKVTISTIFSLIEQRFVIVPFSVSIYKQDVVKYLDSGFQILFMRSGEFKEMKKAYKEYV